MASKTTTTSQHIIEQIGGAENISSLTHCATRLRFQVHNQDEVDVAALESDPAVLGVVKQGSTGVQVVMGGGVAEYYGAIMKEPGMAGTRRRPLTRTRVRSVPRPRRSRAFSPALPCWFEV